MIIISSVLNTFYKLKLQNAGFRHKMFEAAARNKLRKSKMGRIILRNLNEIMSANRQIHEEFKILVGEHNFQEKFWASDLGFLWFTGNNNDNKSYFDETIKLINREKADSLLDVGCGWGVFCRKVAKETNVAYIKGIDVSGAVIAEAVRRSEVSSRLSFEEVDFFNYNHTNDIVTIFGSIDYVTPDKIEAFVSRLISLANKKVVIVNSLRKIKIQDVKELSSSVEVKRYDIGYVHPLKSILDNLGYIEAKTYEMKFSGEDSLMVIINK